MSYDQYSRGGPPQRAPQYYPPAQPEAEEYPADFEPEDQQSRLAPPHQRVAPHPAAYGQQYAPPRHQIAPQYAPAQYQQYPPHAYQDAVDPRAQRMNPQPQMPYVSPPHNQRAAPSSSSSSDVDELLSGLANLGVGFAGNVQRPNTPSAPMQSPPHPQELGDRRGFRPSPIAASGRAEEYQGAPQYQGGYAPENELYGSGSPGQSSRASSAVRAGVGLRQAPPPQQPQQIRQGAYDLSPQAAYGNDPYAAPAGGPMISPGPTGNRKFSSRATMQHFAPDVPQQPVDPNYAPPQDPYAAAPSRNIFARGASGGAGRKLALPADDGGGPPTVPALSIIATPAVIGGVVNADTGTPGSGRGKHRGKLANLNTSNTEDFQKSWDISKGGAFIAGGYEIGNEGISRSPVIKEEAVRTSIAGGYSAHTSPRGGVGDIQPSPTSSAASSGAGSPDPRPASGSNDKFSPSTLLELSSLGKGAGGFVMKALHIPTFQLVALKSVDVFDKNKRHQLIKELHAFESTHHPNVVSYYGAYFSEGSATMVLEFMDRGSLQQVIDKYGPLNEDAIRHIARQCLEGLHCIHSMKQLHRDIKPGNILLNHLGQAKISDFGIAGQLQHTDQWAQTFVGTAIYMSPERIQSLQYSFSADIWSLGMTFITCATGRFPFETGNYWALIKHISQGEPPKLPENFSPAFQDFVARCLVKDPNLRWSAAKLMQHPFLNPSYPTADAQLNYQWPFEVALSKKSLTSTVHMIHTILQKLYIEAGESYRNSPFDQARFSRLAAQTGLDVRHMLQLVQQTYQDLISHPQAAPPAPEEEEEAQEQRGSTAVAGVGGPAAVYVPQQSPDAQAEAPAPVLRLPIKGKGRMALPTAQPTYDEAPDASISFEN